MTTEIKDNTKNFIIHHSPIEENLHVIVVISNPCNFKIKHQLVKDFLDRMENEPNILVYLVELVYNNNPFRFTSSHNRTHLQIKSKTPLWHKENMINLGIKYLLPENWKAVAWVDVEVEFESSHWALDTLKILNGGKDIVQLFTSAANISNTGEILNTFVGFGYKYSKKNILFDMKSCHTGFAWACNRTAYEQMGGIFEKEILGYGDNIMCQVFLKNALNTLKKGLSKGYIDAIIDLQEKCNGLRIGYVPGNIKHVFHDKKEHNTHNDIEDILIKYQFDPYTFITVDINGLIIPTDVCPKEFLIYISKYFEDRNADELILKDKNDSKEKLNYETAVTGYKINFILKCLEKLENDVNFAANNKIPKINISLEQNITQNNTQNNTQQNYYINNDPQINNAYSNIYYPLQSQVPPSLLSQVPPSLLSQVPPSLLSPVQPSLLSQVPLQNIYTNENQILFNETNISDKIDNTILSSTKNQNTYTNDEYNFLNEPSWSLQLDKTDINHNKFHNIYTNENSFLNEQIQSVKIDTIKNPPKKFHNIYTNEEPVVLNKQLQSVQIDNNNTKDTRLLNNILKHIKIDKSQHKHLTSMSFK